MHVLVPCETRNASFPLISGLSKRLDKASQSASPWGARLTCLVQPTCVNAADLLGAPSDGESVIRFGVCWRGPPQPELVILVLDTRPPGRHGPPQRLLGLPLLLERQ